MGACSNLQLRKLTTASRMVWVKAYFTGSEATTSQVAIWVKTNLKLNLHHRQTLSLLDLVLSLRLPLHLNLLHRSRKDRSSSNSPRQCLISSTRLLSHYRMEVMLGLSLRGTVVLSPCDLNLRVCKKVRDGLRMHRGNGSLLETLYLSEFLTSTRYMYTLVDNVFRLKTTSCNTVNVL